MRQSHCALLRDSYTHCVALCARCASYNPVRRVVVYSSLEPSHALHCPRWTLAAHSGSLSGVVSCMYGGCKVTSASLQCSYENSHGILIHESLKQLIGYTPRRQCQAARIWSPTVRDSTTYTAYRWNVVNSAIYSIRKSLPM